MTHKYNRNRQNARTDGVSFAIPGSPLKPDLSLKFEVIDCVRGVISPLLCNRVLDELDRELERRGHHFVRYADDGNI
jgi:hypothetical protein